MWSSRSLWSNCAGSWVLLIAALFPLDVTAQDESATVLPFAEQPSSLSAAGAFDKSGEMDSAAPHGGEQPPRENPDGAPLPAPSGRDRRPYAGSEAQSPSGPEEHRTLGGEVPASSGSLLDREPPLPPVAAVGRSGGESDIEPAEVMVVSRDLQAARQLAAALSPEGYRVLRRRLLVNLGIVLSLLRPPGGTGVRDALENLRARLPEVHMDANHRYRLLGNDHLGGYGRRLIGWGASPAGCGSGLRIGLVDTALEGKHAALAGQDIVMRSFLSAGVKEAATEHGTAVAALLIGSARHGDFAGLLPAARLYAAGVFRQRGRDGEDTTAELVVKALDWLAGHRVAVVNLSMGGQRNNVMGMAVERIMDLGIPVVAASGNGGPRGEPVYPAAYPGVVGVTAVDALRRPWRRSSRGDYLDLAAPGVDVWVASSGGGKYVSGSSFAAPFATAALAAMRVRHPAAGWRAHTTALYRSALDLGEPGRDPVFGWGLLRVPMPCGD